MITFEQFETWALEQGIVPNRCTTIEIVHASVVGRKEAAIWLRAEQVVEDENGQVVVDILKKDALTETVTVPMVSLP